MSVHKKENKINISICYICKFFNPKININNFKQKNKTYGCDHTKPLTINERILLNSPNSTISPVKGNINLFNYPIGTETNKFIKNIEINKFKNMLNNYEPGYNNYEYISKKLITDQEGSKQIQTFLENLTQNSIKEEGRINLRSFKNNFNEEFFLNKEQIEIIWFYKIIKSNLFELSNDPFANYVIQKLLEEKYLQNYFKEDLLENNIYELSKNIYSCRVIQKAILEFDNPEFIFLEILSSFNNLIEIQSSNHVIQKMIENCIEFSNIEILLKIINYSLINLINMSKDKYGCRILQKILELNKLKDKDLILFNNKIIKSLKIFSSLILKNLDILSTDQYGNYVIQHILSLNLDIKDIIIINMLKDIKKYSKQKFASNIIEKVILSKEECYISLIYNKFLENIDGKPCLYYLAKDKYGNYVVQQFYKILEFNDKLKVNLILKKYLNELKNNIYSKHLAHKILYDH